MQKANNVVVYQMSSPGISDSKLFQNKISENRNFAWWLNLFTWYLYRNWTAVMVASQIQFHIIFTVVQTANAFG